MSQTAGLFPAPSPTAQRSGYAASSHRSPTSLAIVIALHVGVAAAVLLMPGQQFIQDISKKFIIEAIPADPVPPPPTPPKQDPIVKAKMQPPVAPDPVFVLPKGDPYVLPPLPPGPINPGTGPGIDTGPIEPPHIAKLIDALPDPRFANRFQPTYPAAMLRLQTEGVVTVRVRIGVDGRVIDVERVTATNDAFWDRTREQALSQWRFRPATRDGVPVESSKTLTVRFKIT